MQTAEKSALTIQREAMSMRKSEEVLYKQIHDLHLSFPGLSHNVETSEEQQAQLGLAPRAATVVVDYETWQTPEAESLLQAITAYRESQKGRYPKSISNLDDYPTTWSNFCKIIRESLKRQ